MDFFVPAASTVEQAEPNHGRQLRQGNRRFRTAISLVTLLLAVVAVSSSPISAAAGRERAVEVVSQGVQPLDHKVIFIQGINSESGNETCNGVGFIEDSRNRVQWMVDYLVDNPWVTDSVPSLDSPQDFAYFSYSGDYCTKTDGSFNYQKPRYSDGDTCDGVRNAAGRLPRDGGANSPGSSRCQIHVHRP